MADASSGDQPRTNAETAEESLIVLKPTLEIDHEGGQRFEPDSWQHHLLLRWIKVGAPGVTQARHLERLDVEPREVVFQAPGEQVSLRVIAQWRDGTREDVTCLCRFRSNDQSITTVDQDGRLIAGGRGDTHVIAFYDNGIAAVPVIRRVSSPRQGPSTAKSAHGHEMDRLVAAKLQKLGITPSSVCSDAEFLRRLSIDVTGSLPTPHEVESFLADSTQDKRLRKIDELLASPGYAAWWTNKLCDFTGCNPRQQAELGQEVSLQWYEWIHRRLQDNMPYDKLVEAIVLATGRQPGQSYQEYAAEMSSYFREDDAAEFSERETMPHYWTRQSMKKPEDKALALAHSFLGIRLQCAQCHKHPWDQWTQEDFQQFSAFFENVRFGLRSDARQAYRDLAEKVGLKVRGEEGSAVGGNELARAQDGETIPWRELYIAAREKETELSLLRSRRVRLAPTDDPRAAIMSWMRDSDNPWFARALVNRVWASYFHMGIVDPPDDLNPANPPSNPELLDWLTHGFIESAYDMNWLHRQIASSATYQRSSRANDSNRHDRRNFSRSIPRRIPAEVVYDSLKQVTAATGELTEVRKDISRRAAGHLSMRMAGTYAMNVFGKPDRSLNCDCERVNQPTLLQAIFMQNDPLVRMRLAQSGWIEQLRIAEANEEPLDRRQLVRNAWLRTVSRPPTKKETTRALEHLDTTASVAEGVGDLLWALVNTREFMLNH